LKKKIAVIGIAVSILLIYAVIRSRVITAWTVYILRTENIILLVNWI
jgi:hypothetical protein